MKYIKVKHPVLAFCVSVLLITSANAQQCQPQVGTDAKICPSDKVCVCNKRPPTGQGQATTWHESPTSSGICPSHGQPFTTCSVAIVPANKTCAYFKGHVDLPVDPPACPSNCNSGAVTLGTPTVDKATQCCTNRKSRACTPKPKVTTTSSHTMNLDDMIDPICNGF